MTPLLTSLTEDPLYTELLTIGRDGLAFQPAKLAGSKHLLDCAEVTRRAGPDAGDARLADCAYEAILAAVDQVGSHLTRKITEAALCITFSGTQVKERAAGLDVSMRQFKYRRERGFLAVITFLRRDAPVAIHDVSGHLPVGLRSARTENIYQREFRRLAENAATLHYASLGILFAFDFDDELLANDIAPHPLAGWYERTTLREYLFDTYLGFVYDDATLRTLQWPLTHEYLSSETVDLLLALLTRVADGSPAGPSRVTAAQRDLLKYRLFTHNREATLQLYNHAWASWCQGRGLAGPTELGGYAVPRSRADLFAAVTPIAGASGAFVDILTRHVRLDVAIHADARVRTHKALANCYEFDEWVPLLDGRSLRHRAEVYFDREGPALTHEALK